MHTMMLRIGTVMTAMFLILFLSTYVNAADPKSTKQQRQVDKMELQISSDGKTIVDQSGREVARFSKDIQMQPMEGGSQKMQGCMCCTNQSALSTRGSDV